MLVISKDDVPLQPKLKVTDGHDGWRDRSVCKAVSNNTYPVIEFADEMILSLSGTECHFQDTVCPKLFDSLKTSRSDVLAKLPQEEAMAPTSATLQLERTFVNMSCAAPSSRSRRELRSCPW